MARGAVAVPIPPISTDAFRKSHEIDGTAVGEQTDYQAKVEIGLFSALPSNAAGFQTTPTSDASGQVVHPSILYFPDGWNGYDYWMAMTPYPIVGGNDWETPEILACNDGVNWVVPAGLVNPIVTRDAASPNVDPFLFYNEATDELWVYYMKWDDPARTWNRIYLKKSSDGINWGGVGLGTLLLTMGFGAMLSPAVVKVGATYHMWYVDETAAPNEIKHRTSADGEAWGAEGTCNLYGTMPSGQEPWHLEIRYMSEYSEYWMLLSITNLGGTGVPGWLLFARSENATNWYLYPEVLLKPSAAGWDSFMTYKATFLLDDTTLRIWYSARDAPANWHVGYTTATLGHLDFFSHVETDGGDLRVTAADGTTELDYFIEEFNYNERYIIIWANIPTIPVSPGTVTIYIYYGKDGAVTTGDGEVVFPWLFDDFDDYIVGDTPNLTDWETAGIAVGNTIKAALDPDDATKKCFEIIETGDGTLTALLALLKGYRASFAIHFRMKGSIDERYFIDGYEDLTTRISVARVHTVDKWQWYNGGAYQDFVPAFPAPIIWFNMEMQVVDVGENYMHLIGNDVDYAGDWRDTPVAGPNKVRLTLYHTTAHRLYVGGRGDDSRYIFVRQFVNPEPTEGAWGDEEEVIWPF